MTASPTAISSEAICPGLERLERFVQSKASDLGLKSHLDECAACRERARAIREDNALLAEFVNANRGRLADAPGAAPLPRIDGYTLLRELHRGGQGVVYRAVQHGAGREVAIKTLIQGAFATSAQRRRFEREIETIAQLRHPNLVTLYGCGCTKDGSTYLAMEYVEGAPLDEYVRAAIAPGGVTADEQVERIVELFIGLCDAVDTAHVRGIMHRDLKPANVLVDEHGRPRVLDFGLARRANDIADVQATERTRPDAFVGTLAYASPERLTRGESAADLRSDVFSIGVMLYELLAGGRPFAHADSLAAFIRTLTEDSPVRPSSRCRAVSRDLDAIVMKCLATEPERRYRTAGALADDLRRSLTGEAVDARRDQSWYLLRKALTRERAPVLAGIGAFIAVASIAGVLANQFALRNELSQSERSAEMRREHFMGSFKAPGPYAVLDPGPFVSIVQSAPGLLDADSTITLMREVEHVLESQESDIEARHEAEILAEVARVYHEVGALDDALRLYERELTLALEAHPSPHAAHIQARHNTATVMLELGRRDEAIHCFRLNVRDEEIMFGEGDARVAWSLADLAAALEAAGRADDAALHYERAIRIIAGRSADQLLADADAPPAYPPNSPHQDYRPTPARAAEGLQMIHNWLHRRNDPRAGTIEALLADMTNRRQAGE